MSNMRRWDPFNEMLSLRDAMNQLLEDSFVSPARMTNRGETFSMPLNVSETQDAFRVEAVVPGLKPEDVDITIQDNVLTIRGETRQEQQTGDKTNYHVMERRYGRFSRSISLPTAVQSDRVQASLENGILHLEIPKAEEVKPRKISVNAGRALGNQTVEVNTDGEQSQQVGQ